MSDLELFDARPLAAQVDESTASRLRRAKSPNTLRAYGRWTRRFDAWCTERGRQPVPADPVTLADYASSLADAGLSRSSLGQAVAAIRYAHQLAGYRDQPDMELASMVLSVHAGDLAAAGVRARQAPPAAAREVLAMVATLDHTRPGDVRDHLLVTLGFGMFARRSELASVQLEDVDEVDGGLTVWIRSTKTDRHADNAGRVAKVVAQPHPDLDPVRAFHTWRRKLEQRGITHGPLLRQLRKGGTVTDRAMSPEAVHAVVRKLAIRAGVPRAAEFSGHSLRAGAATQALKDGASLQSVCRAGGWTDGSQSVALYSRDLEEWRDHPLRNITIRT